jgi:uridine phosphorylase
MSDFLSTPHHINAISSDLAGNNNIGRYIFLPGSEGRAKTIASHFDNVTVKQHSRGHHLYLGTINDNGITIDVASISSGMGCPSLEIILHELLHLGGKRFIRVGTAGSLQKDSIHIGDIINTQASVRDESSTMDYAPLSVPAIASLEIIQAINLAANTLNFNQRVHTGIVHCKSSFYAREFYAGPNAATNKAYMQLLIDNGVLASEMETAGLFIMCQLYNHQLMQQGKGKAFRVLSGAILGIGAIPPDVFMTKEQEQLLTEDTIALGLATVKTLAASEREVMCEALAS